MIKAFTGAAKRLAGKPFTFLPALAAMAVLLLLAFVFAGFAVDILLDVAFLEGVPDSALNALPFQFGALYAAELSALFVFALLSAVLLTTLNYWYAVYAREEFDGNASLGKACGETLEGFGKIASLVVFFLLILCLWGITLWLFAMIAAAVPLLGTALLVLWCLTSFYLYIKLVFTVQALALEQGTVKQALQQSWGFSVGRFWHLVLFLIVLSLLNQAVIQVGGFAAELVVDEWAGVAVLALFWSVFMGFAGMAMPLYYAEKRVGKSI